MAEPATLGTAGITLSGAGTGLGVVGKLLGADSTKKQYLYQARVAQINKQIQEQNAKWARDTGERENLIFGMKAGQRMGQITASQGASGIDVNSEGSERVRTSQAGLDKMDREQISENAARRAYGFDVAAWNEGNKANAYSTASKNASKAGVIGAATSLISGATSVADKWYQGKISGMWDETSVTEPFGGQAAAKGNRDWRWDLR